MYVRLHGVLLRRERRVVRWRDFFARPLLPTLVGLLVCVASWCWWCRLCSSDEVLSSFVSGDVDVRFPE
jgi:hypothetical protein